MDGWRDVHTGCHLYLDGVCVPWLVSLFPVPESFIGMDQFRQGRERGRGKEVRLAMRHYYCYCYGLLITLYLYTKKKVGTVHTCICK